MADVQGLYTLVSPGQFRLLHIVGDGGEMVECKMNSYDLAKCPGYTAISYTWGSAEDLEDLLDTDIPGVEDGPFKIKVNGCIIEVTENLFDLLHELCRVYDSTHNWWIDAICINQSDDEEKTGQVNQMAQVYGVAFSVLVWLGRGNANTPRTIKLLQNLGEAFTEELLATGNIRKYADISDPLNPQQMSRLGVQNMTEDDWVAVIMLLRRRWFFRVWTVQEMALGKDVIVRWGQHELGWTWLVGTVRLIAETSLLPAIRSIIFSRTKRYKDPLIVTWFQYMYGLVAGQEVKMGSKDNARLWSNSSSVYSNNAALLNDLLLSLRNFLATNPRDHVFGILGIMDKLTANSFDNQPTLRANYAKSTRDVYIETMTYILNGKNTLTTLSRVQGPSKVNVDGLPSWVVDFSGNPGVYVVKIQDQALYKTKLVGPSHEAPRFFDACNSVTNGFHIDGPRLCCHSLVHARITQISESRSDPAERYSFEQTAALVLASLEHNRQADTQVDLLWKSSLGGSIGRDSAGHPADICEKLRQAFRCYVLVLSIESVIFGLKSGKKRSQILEALVNQERLSEVDKSGTIPGRQDIIDICDRIGILEDGIGPVDEVIRNEVVQGVQPFQDRSHVLLWGRRLFSTDHGLIGVGSEDVEPGDELCIISDGGRTPFVLRHADQMHTDERILIGEAYVHGLMFGEAVDSMEESGKTWSQICIV